jgi:hypothetical protein
MLRAAGFLGAVAVMVGIFVAMKPHLYSIPSVQKANKNKFFTTGEVHFFAGLGLAMIGFIPTLIEVNGHVIIPKLRAFLQGSGPLLASLGSLLP